MYKKQNLGVKGAVYNFLAPSSVHIVNINCLPNLKAKTRGTELVSGPEKVNRHTN